MACYVKENLGNVQGIITVRVEMVPKASQRHLQTPLEIGKLGTLMHTCLNSENAVPTCHVFGFESPSGLRNELGFILGVILKGRHEGTLRHHAHHPASLQPSPTHLHLGAEPPGFRGSFRVCRGGRQRRGCLLTSVMVAVVDVISIAVSTSPPVRISHHWPGGPGGKERRAGGGDGRVTPGGGRKRRCVVQSTVAAWVWRRNQAPAGLSISFSFGLRSPDVPCTAGPPPPTAGSWELPARSSALRSPACPSLSQHSLEAPPP